MTELRFFRWEVVTEVENLRPFKKDNQQSCQTTTLQVFHPQQAQPYKYLTQQQAQPHKYSNQFWFITYLADVIAGVLKCLCIWPSNKLNTANMFKIPDKLWWTDKRLLQSRWERRRQRELGKMSRNTNGAQLHLHVKLHDPQASPIQSALISSTVHTLPCVLHAWLTLGRASLLLTGNI